MVKYLSEVITPHIDSYIGIIGEFHNVMKFIVWKDVNI
jgi:hypothetical protein